ncbi:MAG: Wzz/FepE/Etk N-terminal domain-containing protein [Cytophagales bacterium]|nr:Wzz/FepE/Etk N-terminal domain-containing protein [Cytophagales bacterium]
MKTIDINIFFIVDAVKKRFKAFAYTNLAIVLLATGVSFLLPVYYESKIVFYPYSPEASDPRTLLAEEIFVAVFSDIDQSEKFILLGKSRSIKKYVIDKYNLYKRYKIDPQKPGAEYKILKTLEENFKFKKLENGGVEISVFDYDRDTAAYMANDIVTKIDITANQNIKIKNQKLFDVYEMQHNRLLRYVNSLKDSLKAVRKNRRTDMKNEVALNNQIAFAMEEYTKIKFRYEQSSTIKDYDLKTLMVVEEAQPNYEKARPKRAYIVAGAFAVGLLLTTVVFASIEFFKKMWK